MLVFNIDNGNANDNDNDNVIANANNTVWDSQRTPVGLRATIVFTLITIFLLHSITLNISQMTPDVMSVWLHWYFSLILVDHGDEYSSTTGRMVKATDYYSICKCPLCSMWCVYVVLITYGLCCGGSAVSSGIIS